MADLVQITKSVRSFKVMTLNAGLRRALEMHNEMLVQVKPQRGKWGSNEEVSGDEYFIFNEHELAYYYINIAWERVMNVIDAYSKNRGPDTLQVVISSVPVSMGTDVSFDSHNLAIKEPEDSRFFFQNEIVEAVSAPGVRHDILEIQTGRGKTAMAMKAIVNVGKRTLIITKAGYIGKWTKDLTDGSKPSLRLKKGELIRVAGVDAVDAVIDLGRAGELDGKSGKPCKVILMSSHTLDLWIRHNLKHKTEYAVDNLVADLGIGQLLYDESHELFRMNYWSFILLNAPRVVDLTATIVPGKDTFRVARYHERFPTEARYNKLDYVVYIDAFSVYYGIDDKDVVRRINSLSMYNHIELEKLFIKKKKTLHKYFDMVYELMTIWYLKERQEGQRALIMFASQDMCSLFKCYIGEKRPDLKVVRFIQGDDYEKFLDADIGVSTPGKSGTAVDIPGLILTLCTVCLGKEDKNLQILGRTREVTKWDIIPRIVYIHCSQLVKHIRYLNIRKDLLATKTNKFQILSSNFRI